MLSHSWIYRVRRCWRDVVAAFIADVPLALSTGLRRSSCSSMLLPLHYSLAARRTVEAVGHALWCWILPSGNITTFRNRGVASARRACHDEPRTVDIFAFPILPFVRLPMMILILWGDAFTLRYICAFFFELFDILFLLLFAGQISLQHEFYLFVQLISPTRTAFSLWKRIYSRVLHTDTVIKCLGHFTFHFYFSKYSISL